MPVIDLFGAAIGGLRSPGGFLVPHPVLALALAVVAVASQARTRTR